MLMPREVLTWLRGAFRILPGTASKSFQATASKAAAMSPFFRAACAAASGWAVPSAQRWRVVRGMPSCSAVLSTFPPFAAKAARALARSSSLYRRFATTTPFAGIIPRRVAS